MEQMTLEERISAAVEEVVAATNPEQVVLFGSAAKGTAGPDSDIDLLVIGDPRRHADGRRTCTRTGDEVDVFVTDQASARRYRYSATYLEGIALGEGRTVYARDPDRTVPAGEKMIKRTLYDPDKAVRMGREGAQPPEALRERRGGRPQVPVTGGRGGTGTQGADRRRGQAR